MQPMIFLRQTYLDKLISGRGNGLVKIVTGGRRCGKSFLLFTLFHDWLISRGVGKDHLIELSLDDMRSKELRDPVKLLDYIDSHINDDGQTHYVILDEVQLVGDFVEVLLSLMHNRQLEVYVSGSNSKFLSKDVVTEFRGRGSEIHVWPLSFKEYFDAIGGDKQEAWLQYYTYGGMPQVLLMETEQEKRDYLKNIYELTYIKDVIDRNNLRNPDGLRQIVQVLASSIGSPTNVRRISNTFKSAENLSIGNNTIKEYIGYLQDAFMIEEALRYDVKGRKYIGTETKYYFSDLGLRGVALNFRQQEEPHIMENIIYNELRSRGYLVDVGMVTGWTRDEEGTTKRQTFEIDFVVNNGANRVYIQSAYKMPTEEKEEQEQRSLLKVDDSFKKIIIVWDNIKSKVNEQGIQTISLLEFLLDAEAIDKLL
jgi:hypothetical protein